MAIRTLRANGDKGELRRSMGMENPRRRHCRLISGNATRQSIPRALNRPERCRRACSGGSEIFSTAQELGRAKAFTRFFDVLPSSHDVRGSSLPQMTIGHPQTREGFCHSPQFFIFA